MLFVFMLIAREDSWQRSVDGSRVQAEKIPGEVPRPNAQRHPRAGHTSLGAVHPRHDRHRHGQSGNRKVSPRNVMRDCACRVPGSRECRRTSERRNTLLLVSCFHETQVGNATLMYERHWCTASGLALFWIPTRTPRTEKRSKEDISWLERVRQIHSPLVLVCSSHENRLLRLINTTGWNLIVNLLHRLHLVIENLELRKLSTFLIDRAKLSLIGPTIAINISIPEIYASGHYNISGILGDTYRLRGEGPFQGTIRDFRAYVNTALGYSKGMYLKSFVLDFSLRTIKIHLENFMGGVDIGKIMSKVRLSMNH